MPFPLAHPAAVLPLGRHYPRYLSFPALIIGSLSPDVGYCSGHFRLGEFSHRLLPGSSGFCTRAALLRAWLGLRFVICEVPLTGTRALFSEERACKTALGIGWLVDLKIESTHWKWLLLFAQ